MKTNDLPLNQLNLSSAVILNEGISNTSYLLNDQFVMRIKGQNFDLFNHIENENEVLEKLRGNSYMEEVLSFNEENGTKLSRFIPDTTRLSTPPTKEEISLVASTLREFHFSDKTCTSEFDLFKRIDFYKRPVLSVVNKKYEEQILDRTKALYEKYPLILCHNDLVKGNLLFTKKQLYLIDFEFASMNIEIFDIASFLSENNLRDEESLQIFEDAYKPFDHDDVKLMMKAQDILWYYWAKYMFIKTKKVIYDRIAEEKYTHVLEGMKDE